MAGLVEVERQQPENQIPPSGVLRQKRRRPRGSLPQKATQGKKSRKKDHLAAKVDILPSQFAEMTEVCLNLQPNRPIPQANSPQAAAPAPV